MTAVSFIRCITITVLGKPYTQNMTLSFIHTEAFTHEMTWHRGFALNQSSKQINKQN